MQLTIIKRTALFAAIQSVAIFGAWASDNDATALAAAPAVQAVAAQPVSAASDKAEQAAQVKESGRFVTKKGTGSSQAVSTAPVVKLPPGPLGAAPADINKILAETQRAGGQPLDPIQREMNMPGLKKDDPALKPFVLHTRNGVNEIVKMSSRLLNRIATPFKKPVLIETTGADAKIVGSDIYFTPKGDDPIGLFIADASNTSQTISLTIIPDQAIPGQNLIIKLEDLRAVRNAALTAATGEEADLLQPKPSDHTSNIRSLLTKAVRGNVPGFSPVPMEGGVARMGTLDIEPDLTFAGSVVDIYRYRLTNKGTEPLDMVETAFFRNGVKAVSFFPHLSLQPGQQGYVFLLADKPAAAQGAQ